MRSFGARLCAQVAWRISLTATEAPASAEMASTSHRWHLHPIEQETRRTRREERAVGGRARKAELSCRVARHVHRELAS